VLVVEVERQEEVLILMVEVVSILTLLKQW
jgi:hypothetical protein